MFPKQEQDPARDLSALEDDSAWMHEVIRHACNEDPTFRPALQALHQRLDGHYANTTSEMLRYLQAYINAQGRPSNAAPRIKTEAAEPVLVKKEERDIMLPRAPGATSNSPTPEELLARADITMKQLLAKAQQGARIDKSELADLEHALRIVEETVKSEEQ